jgi:hypothetical protein
MSELKATPGEWHVAIGTTYCCVRTGSSELRTGGVIADMRIAGGYYNIFDANLIAAAPDLYDALENLLKVHKGEGGSKFHAGDIARAALAKARGEP